MGLLTDPKSREKFVKFISKYNNILCGVCYLSGLAWFLVLAHRPFNAGTYFSENALLPGLVEADFYNDHGAGDFMRELRAHLKSIKEKDKDKELIYQMPADWMASKLQGLGLDTYVHNFSFQYPSGILRDQKFDGRNVYGIMRAPRAGSTEALVLSVPYRPPGVDLPGTNAGIALMLGLAKAFRKRTYWAKDVIFLVTEHETVGMQAWLSAYHGEPSNYIRVGHLAGRSGSIQAAVNLEIPMDPITNINIKVEGLNGQLPNLDLVNTVVRLCGREGITPKLQKRADYMGDQESPEAFQHSLKTMMLMMWNQASGTASGNHGLFHRYNIEAVTLQGIKIRGSYRNHGFPEVGRVVEGILRSLNNLLERFHQSFFFYLLPSTDRYVSIGLYMPPFGLLAVGTLIKAVALWISAHSLAQGGDKDTKAQEGDKGTKAQEGDKDTKAQEGDEGTKAQEGDEGTKAQEGDVGVKSDSQTTEQDLDATGDKQPEGKTDRTEESSLVSVLPACIMCGFFGLIAYYSSTHFIDTANAMRMSPGEGLVWGSVALMFSAVLFPRALMRKTRKEGDEVGPSWKLIKFVALVMLAVVMATTALFNISLAFFLSVVLVPVALVTTPTESRVLHWLQCMLLLLVSPLGLLYIACLIQHSLKGTGDLVALATDAWDSLSTAMILALIDAHLLSSWTYTLFTTALFPNWLLFWALLWTQPSS